MEQKQWNPRFVAYAQYYGFTPEEMRADMDADAIQHRRKFDGGFFCWMQVQIPAFHKHLGHRYREGYGWPDLTHEESEQFTEWLFKLKRH